MDSQPSRPSRPPPRGGGRETLAHRQPSLPLPLIPHHHQGHSRAKSGRCRRLWGSSRPLAPRERRGWCPRAWAWRRRRRHGAAALLWPCDGRRGGILRADRRHLGRRGDLPPPWLGPWAAAHGFDPGESPGLASAGTGCSRRNKEARRSAGASRAQADDHGTRGCRYLVEGFIAVNHPPPCLEFRGKP